MDGQDLGSAIKEIERITNAAIRTTVLDVKGEPKGMYYLVGPDGKAELQTAEPAWHSELLDTPEELKKFIEVFQGITFDNVGADKGEADPAVFIAPGEIIFVHDLADRRDVSLCTLAQTEAYKWLAEKSGSQMTQADFIRLLRITFRGCTSADSVLISLLRKLQFNAASEVSGNLQHGRESVGRSIQSEMVGKDAVPEELTLNVPIFENHVFVAPITCAIEIFPQERVFKLTPYPMQVRRAMDEAMADIETVLTGEDMPPVFRGKP